MLNRNKKRESHKRWLRAVGGGAERLRFDKLKLSITNRGRELKRWWANDFARVFFNFLNYERGREQGQKTNKRGDIPVAILVLGTFALCALALLSFYASGIFVENNFFGPNLVEQMNSNINEYSFYSSKNLNAQEIQKILLLEENFYIGKNQDLGEFFEINKTITEFKFGGLSFDSEDWSEEKLLISVRYYLK